MTNDDSPASLLFYLDCRNIYTVRLKTKLSIFKTKPQQKLNKTTTKTKQNNNKNATKTKHPI